MIRLCNPAGQFRLEGWRLALLTRLAWTHSVETLSYGGIAGTCLQRAAPHSGAGYLRSPGISAFLYPPTSTTHTHTHTHTPLPICEPHCTLFGSQLLLSLCNMTNADTWEAYLDSSASKASKAVQLFNGSITLNSTGVRPGTLIF